MRRTTDGLFPPRPDEVATGSERCRACARGASTLDAKATQLRHALRTTARSGVSRGHPKALRARILADAGRTASAGRPRAEVADALGLSLATLVRWAQPAAPAAPAFRPLVVAPEPTAIPA
jgi:hypothetical protein